MNVRRRIPLIAALAIVAASCAGADDNEAAETSSTPADSSATTEASTAPESTDGPDSTEPDAMDTPESTEPDATDAPESTEPPTTPEDQPVTPAATAPVESATWALYREPNTLDPIYAFDYPENTTIAAMCESVLRQEPDGTIVSGLASIDRPDETTIVLTVRDDVQFWDGSPLTADDVAFSLQRQIDPALGGFYGAAYFLVESIEVTGPNEVTLALSAPDYWLDGVLASMGGIVVSQAYAEEVGPAYGTPDGGVMCTGAYALDNWAIGDRVSVLANPEYWGGAPLTGAIDFVGVFDEATLTSALLTGDVDGSYLAGLSGLDQLESDPGVTVSSGPSYASTALIVSNLEGVLGDPAVRQALSLAIDRQGMIDTLYKGEAVLPTTLANPGSWGYGRSVFEAAWAELPEPVRDVDAARAMAEAAGVAGQKVVFATTNEIASAATAGNVLAAAAEDIGLEVELVSMPAATYISLFTDPAAREGIDGFFTVNYSDSADPAALYATFALPYGSQNYSGYDNPDVTALLESARSTADPDARAALVVEAQAIIMDELPWIGLALPNTVLATSADLTGPPTSFIYMNAPWANGLGGVG